MGQWSNLPLELLEVIESKLHLYFDKVRIRIVCKSWRSYLPNLRNHKYPWLLYNLYGKTEGTHGLFNPIDNKTYEIDLKNAKEIYVVGCSHGWIAFFNDCIAPLNNPQLEIYLINMFTNTRVDLPPTIARYRVYKKMEIRKIVLSSPFADENCTAVAVYHFESKVTYCKCGDKTWKYLNTDGNAQDVIFHEGKLLVLNWDGSLSVFEEIGPSAKPKSVIQIFEPFWFSWAYLVKPSTGGIIVVYIKGNIYAQPPTECFELYKIDLINAERVRIYDIGDNNMFLDDTSAMMVSSTGDERNQIYIIITCNTNINSSFRSSDNEASLSVFDLEKGTLRVLLDSKICSEVCCPGNFWVKMN